MDRVRAPFNYQVICPDHWQTSIHAPIIELLEALQHKVHGEAGPHDSDNLLSVQSCAEDVVKILKVAVAGFRVSGPRDSVPRQVEPVPASKSADGPICLARSLLRFRPQNSFETTCEECGPTPEADDDETRVGAQSRVESPRDVISTQSSRALLDIGTNNTVCSMPLFRRDQRLR